ncbi:MAG: GGDEF domain-containing protein [Treponema sp.]|nr:GGDEF domain-containing protein [Treponema sp.]
MNIFEYFNTALGSVIVIIIIAADYLRKYNTDRFQRKLFIIVLCSLFFSMIFDYLGLTLEKKSEEEYNKALYYIWSLYFIARNCVFYYSAVFIDYFAHGSVSRTKSFARIVTVFIFLYTISLILNINNGYYFYISKENLYMPGILYMLQIFFGYLPIIIILIDLSLASESIKRIQVFLTFVFVILAAVGAALDIILGTTNLIWPCITAGILYVYFFLIRTDSKIDSLTGIGNRNSFNEYLFSISNQSSADEYTFVLLDLVYFREINDKLGHIQGDNALRDISSIIKGCIRATDFAARLGADEFVLVTSGADDVQKIINRINESIENQNIKRIRPYQLHISYSYDVYRNGTGWTTREFLAQLEGDMSKSKESRREEIKNVITKTSHSGSH